MDICYVSVRETLHFFEMRSRVIKPISKMVSSQNFVFLLKCSVPICETFQSIHKRLYCSLILEYTDTFAKEIFLTYEDPLKHFFMDTHN